MIKIVSKILKKEKYLIKKTNTKYLIKEFYFFICYHSCSSFIYSYICNIPPLHTVPMCVPISLKRLSLKPSYQLNDHANHVDKYTSYILLIRYIYTKLESWN